MSDATRIALVDDDRDDIEVALRAAYRERLPVVITVYSDGKELLEALGVEGNGEHACERPQAIFLDLRMPRIDGWEILRRIRANPDTREIPVIVQSWTTRPEDIERCYALGANRFVEKRLTPGNPGFYFAEAVRSWMSKSIGGV
jgi:CheY-like chemotaxis protein